jgi:circadian clock protein KaiC
MSQRRQLSSGLPELDALIGGGLEEGSSTCSPGRPAPASPRVAAQFVHAASPARRASAMFLFEEARHNLLNRCTNLGLDLRHAIDNGLLTIQQIDPAELSPGEFTHAVMQAVDRGVRVVVIDSLNGYLNAVPDERFLTIYLHELLTYLGQRGVVSILVGVQSGMLGAA